MKKPESLRAYLIDCVAQLKKHPAMLQVFIEQGKIACKQQAGLTFRWDYTLTLALQEYSGDADAVMVPLLAWCRTNQIDMPDDAINFEAEIIDHQRYDMIIRVPLSEATLVRTDDDGNYQTEHIPEPVPEENMLPAPDLFKQLYADNQGRGPDLLTPVDEE